MAPTQQNFNRLKATGDFFSVGIRFVACPATVIGLFMPGHYGNVLINTGVTINIISGVALFVATYFIGSMMKKMR